MNPIRRFEDLIAWQLGRELVANIYRVSRKGNFAKDRGLCGQIQSAALSITSNLAEGFERGSPADFHKFLIIAKASCAEVRSQLYIAKDNGYLTEEEFQILMSLGERVGSLVGGLRESVRRRLESE